MIQLWSCTSKITSAFPALWSIRSKTITLYWSIYITTSGQSRRIAYNLFKQFHWHKYQDREIKCTRRILLDSGSSEIWFRSCSRLPSAFRLFHLLTFCMLHILMCDMLHWRSFTTPLCCATSKTSDAKERSKEAWKTSNQAKDTAEIERGPRISVERNARLQAPLWVAADTVDPSTFD